MRILAALTLLATAGAASGCRQPPPPAIAETPTASPATTAAITATTATAGAAIAPAPRRAPLSPEEARQLAKRAGACLTDPRCSVEETRRLFAEAVDAEAIHPGCFDFYYGLDVAADPARARACFERKVAAEKPCGGASPSLERSYLGLMLLDAQGGPRERERGRALFADCLSEGAIAIDATEKREKSGDTTRPIDYCADVPGTTIDQTECASLDGERAAFETRKATKEMFAALAVDEAGFALWSKARDAWVGFSTADAAYARDFWRGGTGAPVVYEANLAAHQRERPDVLHALLDPPAKPDPPGEAEGALKWAEDHAVAAADAPRKKLLADAQTAWRAYRAAETAFVRRAFAARYGSADAAEKAARAALARRRVEALRQKD